MAENCAVAFGRYLRMLRERRGLSLDDVATMSRSLADPVDKSYLSRCENGRHGIGFSKAITLSRIYGVPTEVLAERLELDTELDRIGGPDTSGLTPRRAAEAGGGGVESRRRVGTLTRTSGTRCISRCAPSYRRRSGTPRSSISSRA